MPPKTILIVCMEHLSSFTDLGNHRRGSETSFGNRSLISCYHPVLRFDGIRIPPVGSQASIPPFALMNSSQERFLNMNLVTGTHYEGTLQGDFDVPPSKAWSDLTDLKL